MKDTEQSTPEVEMKALQYVNVGYQRILTFECDSGGFNWWEGDNPGNPILSALAIMMLRDTQEVYSAVDENVIDRSFQYLKKLQKPDGSWAEDRHLHAGNENLGAGTLRSTCYITWALVSGGYSDTGAAKNALQFIEAGLPEEKDLYTMGLCANALAATGKKSAALKGVLRRIHAAAVKDGDKMHWEQKGQTLVNSGGIAAHVEISALMALSFIESGTYTRDVPAIVNWLIATKDPNGNWGYNTQATVLALKTFLGAAKMDPGETNADVTVTLNGKKMGSQHFDNFNKDVLWQVELSHRELGNRARLVIGYKGEGNLGYQVVSGHFVPWKGGKVREEPLTIDVRYDRTKVKVNETVKVAGLFRKNDPEATGMVLATLGVPPGFDVMTEDLEFLKKEKAIRNYELTGRQLLLYLDGLPTGELITLEYRLKARYPVKAQTGESEVRLYYQGDVKSIHKPQTIEAL